MASEGGLSAHEHTLKKVFSSDFDFYIPVYQRPYAWDAEHTVQLVEDLEQTLDDETDEPYFLGSLVLVKEGNTTYAVIDGQQRLTTLTILFSVIRDLSSDLSISTTLSNSVLEPGDALDGLQPKPRLTLRKQDAKFFEDFIQKPGNILKLIALTDQAAPPGPKQAIRNNAKALHERLSTWDETRRHKLASVARNRTYLVVVSTPSLSSAHRIFSVLNARGLDLSPTDIFKSEIIGNLPEAMQDAYGTKWEDAEEELGREAFEDLFRDIRTLVSKERARLQLLREFKEQVLDAELAAGKAQQVVDDLVLPYAKAFAEVSAKNYGPGEEWELVNQWLKRLDRFDNTDWRPAALWAVRTNTDDPKFLASFLEKLERLAAISMLLGEYTTPRAARYIELLKQISCDGIDAAGFEPPASELADALKALDGEIYRMRGQRRVLILLRLDELIEQAAGVTYQHNIITIEHVLPQNPAASSQWVTDFSPEQREVWTNRLANLVLLNRRKNSEAQNYDYAKKKAKYFTSSKGAAPFALTLQVLQQPSWTPDVLEARQSTLVSLLAKAWRLN